MKQKTWLLAAVPVLLVVGFVMVPTAKYSSRAVGPDGSVVLWSSPFDADSEHQLQRKSGLQAAIEGRLRWLGIL